ncbi:MAG: ribonuclease HI family protein [Candidatus Bathyarchaeota archaeon]|uniref:ribonuclease HI family protein n=1 Tax=Candidatus Bathycorpusculum sp. TaxID=2994959 RepID=UPI00281B2859|nr:ribonuclease HI family protein [Candidatus Termiticorpusculum sp.]MCL2293160.1 ribonuclease HI family protein [Candidatus Termiticorpusculum sp.]
MVKRLVIYSDGGARGNPGPAAAAFLAMENSEIIKTDTQFLGIRTNNQAEYEALTMGLEYALNTGAEEVICYLDSELVGRQMKGEYSVKNLELRKLYLKAHAIRIRFKKAEFYNVARSNSFIQKADALVNKTLDNNASIVRSNNK